MTTADRSTTDIRSRAIKGTAWYMGTRVATQGISWVVTLILARLLTPADYGLFGMALAVTAFLELFQQMGLGSAIVQRRELSRRDLNTVFWVVSGVSILMAAVTWTAAGPVAAFYRYPDVTWVVRALALMLVLDALGMVSYSLLTRRIDFRRRSLSELASVVVGSGISLGMAWHGHGVWALVTGHLVRAAVRNGTLMALSGWLPGLDVSLRDSRSLFRFGVNVAGATILREIRHVVNTAILGRVLGSQALGLYSMAGSLGVSPFHKLSTAVINQLSLPVFSRLQADPASLKRYFMRISKYLAIVALPTQIGIAVVSADLVPVLLSERWLAIVPILRVVSIAAIWHIMVLPAAPALTARGSPQIVLRYSAISFVLSSTACALAAPYGIEVAAITLYTVFCVLRSVLLGTCLREIGVGPGEYLRGVRAPGLAALGMIVGILLARAGLPSAGHLDGLLRDIVFGATVYPALLLLLDRPLGGEIRGVLHTLRATQKG